MNSKTNTFDYYDLKGVDLNSPDTAGGEAVETWLKSALRFGDEFPSICYALGISRQEFCSFFPEIYSFEGFYNSVKGCEWPSFSNFEKNNFQGIHKSILNEINDKTKWNWDYLRQVDWSGRQAGIPYTVKKQLKPVKKNIKRMPKNVLDVGSGRGTIAHALNYCGVPNIVALDNGDHFETLCKITRDLFFKGATKINTLHCNIENALNYIKLEEFDTIIFCETIEHFTEKQIENFWNELCNHFHGVLIITNRLNYHPIPINLPHHVREINDNVYNKFILQSKNCIFRSGSHLVLEF